MFFWKYIGLFKSDAATTPFSTCSSSLQSHPQHCERAFAQHMSKCWDARIGFCHYWQKGLRKHSGSGCASQDAQHVHRTCVRVCVRESGLGWLASRKAKMCQSGQRELEMKLQVMCQMPMKLNDFSSPERCHSDSQFNLIGKGNTSTNSRRATMLLEWMDVIKWYV